MSEVKKCIVAVLAVVLAGGAVIVGATVRSKNELGGEGEGTMVAGTMRQYLASRDDSVDVPAADYFYALSEKLKQEYVEQVKEDEKIAVGAVRGMVASLGDRKSFFMSEPEFQAYLKARQGEYSGIGVDLDLQFDDDAPEKNPAKEEGVEPESNETSPEAALILGFRIPRVVISNVVPGGPADRAGLKAGDIVYSVDNHWIANAEEFNQFRDAQTKFLDKTISKEQYTELRNDMRKKTERAILPTKVREKLTVGAAGAIEVVVLRDGQKVTAQMEKAPSKLPGFSVQGDVVRLPLVGDAATELKKAIAGKSAITLDLRNNLNGDFKVAKEVLAILAPNGKYGGIATERSEAPEVITIDKGNPTPPKVNLLVDQTTGGAAEILALALSNHAKATLSGSVMSKDRSIRELVQLPDGSGYTLVTGEYRPNLDIPVMAKGGSK